jgi:hypothetical protein
MRFVEISFLLLVQLFLVYTKYIMFSVGRVARNAR